MAESQIDLEWSIAFAKQALSDLRVMELLLETSEIERCHWLHYLQMGAEKVCKAHLSLSGHENVRKTHGYTTSTLPGVAKFMLAAEGAKSRNSSWQMSAIKKFAHEIDMLAPASHDNFARQDNCEYPWAAAQGTVIVPCEYKFAKLPENDRTLILIVRILRTAAEHYARI